MAAISALIDANVSHNPDGTSTGMSNVLFLVEYLQFGLSHMATKLWSTRLYPVNSTQRYPQITQFITEINNTSLRPIIHH